MLRLLATVAMAMLVVGMIAQGTEGQLTLGQTVTTVIADTNHAGYALFVGDTTVYLVQSDGVNAPSQLASQTLGGLDNGAVSVVGDFTTSATVSYFYVVTSQTPCTVVLFAVDYSGANPTLSREQKEDANMDQCTTITGEPAGTGGYVVTSRERPARAAVAGMDTSNINNFDPGNEIDLNTQERPVGCAVATGGMQYWGLLTTPGEVVRTTYTATNAVVARQDDLVLTGINNLGSCVVGGDQIYFASTDSPGSVVRVDISTFTQGDDSFTAPAASAGFISIEYNPTYNDLVAVTSGTPSQLFRLALVSLTETQGSIDLSTEALSTAATSGTTLFVNVGAEVDATVLAAPPPPPPPAPLNCAQYTTCGPCDATPCSWCPASGVCEDPGAVTCAAPLTSSCPSPSPLAAGGGGGDSKSSSKAGLAVGLTFMFLVLIALAAGAGYLYYRREQKSYSSASTSGLFDDVVPSSSGSVHANKSAPMSSMREAQGPLPPAQTYSRDASSVQTRERPEYVAPARPSAASVFADDTAAVAAGGAAGAGAGAAVAVAAASLSGGEEAKDVIGYDNPFFEVEDEPMEEDGFTPPPVVIECIEWLSEKGLNEEGLFRIPGNLTVMKELLARYNDGESGLVAEMRDEHDVAGLLKLYFREQMMSFIPRRYYERLRVANDITDRNTRIAAMRSVLTVLTPARFHVLGLLVQLFVAVTDNYKVNKMKVSNMAKVFAPTFFKGMSSMGLANSIMATWIKDFEPIFQAEDYPEF